MDHLLVVAPHFENGIVNIMKQETEEMCGLEKKACHILERENWKHLHPLVEEEFSQNKDEVIDVIEGPTQFAKCLHHAKNKSSKRQKNDGKYIDNCNWIAATTCEVEQIFPCVAIS